MTNRAWWRLATFVIPLQMVAEGFTAIFSGKPSAMAWLAGAGVVFKVGTGFLRHAEGMKFHKFPAGKGI
jgi:hypothetical protein